LGRKIEGWHLADIVAEVRKRGSSLAGVAREHGLARQTLYWALIEPRPRANRAIAEFLGVPLNVLWPRWFDASGKLISRTRAPRPAVQPMTLRTHASRAGRKAA